MPPAKPIAPSAIRPPNLKASGRLLRYSALENIRSRTPTLSLNTFGSAEATIMVPSGTPIRPPIRNGQTSERSKLFHIEGSVEVCAITEQISTSGTASEGGRT